MIENHFMLQFYNESGINLVSIELWIRIEHSEIACYIFCSQQLVKAIYIDLNAISFFNVFVFF